MSHSSHPPPVARRDQPTTLLGAFLTRDGTLPRRAVPGQGLVEYSLILVLVAIVVIGSVSMLGNQTSDVYAKVSCSLSGGTYHQDNGQGHSNRCVTNNAHEDHHED
jgi:pilus assembly protein Flp/PilA